MRKTYENAPREPNLKTEQTGGKTPKTLENQSENGCEPRRKRLKSSLTQVRKHAKTSRKQMTNQAKNICENMRKINENERKNRV